MNPKINKLKGTLRKNRQKVSALQDRNRELEKQIRELEDLEIIGLVRESGMTIEEFIASFQTVNHTRKPIPAETEADHAED